MENTKKTQSDIGRRDVLKLTTAMLGYTLTAGTAAAILNGCKADTSTGWVPSFMSKDQLSLVAEVAEMIIPETDIAGAKTAMVDRYMDAMLESYSAEERKMFLDGLSLFDQKSKKLNKVSFMKADEEQRKAVLDDMVKESKNAKGPHIWNIVKEGTVSGYCKSEVGATQLLNYDPVPGPYQGCVDFSTIGKTSYI